MTAQYRPRHRKEQKKTPAIESLIFANRLSDSRAESIRFSHLPAHGLCIARPRSVSSSVCSASSRAGGICSASLWIGGVCSASLWIVSFCSAFSRTENLCSASSRLEDAKPTPAHVELMPFQAIALLSCHRHGELEFRVHSQAAPAEQGCRRGLGPLPIPESEGSTQRGFSASMRFRSRREDEWNREPTTNAGWAARPHPSHHPGQW
jgi:hypothetical protein